MVERIPSQGAFEKALVGPREAKLKRACADFESLFISQMLKSMRKTVPENGLLQKGNTDRIYEALFHEHLAAEISRTRGIGLARVLFEGLKGREGDATAGSPWIQENGKMLR